MSRLEKGNVIQVGGGRPITLKKLVGARERIMIFNTFIDSKPMERFKNGSGVSKLKGLVRPFLHE